MKKFLLSIAAVAAIASASALPKAFYVKQGDNITKYRGCLIMNVNIREPI